MNMKRKPVCALLLGLLVIVFPMIASAATDAAIAQEIHVTNTPIRGTIEIDKQGPVLTGFSEHEDAFGYTVHTPQFADGLLAGAVYEVRAAEDIVGKSKPSGSKPESLPPRSRRRQTALPPQTRCRLGAMW